MVLALDEGDVLLEERTGIGEHENAGELLDRLAVLGGEAAVRALDLVEAGKASFTPQDPARATYARRTRKEQGRIDWTKSAAEIARHVRAMTPWPGARTSAPGGKDLLLLDVRDVALSTALPGVLATALAAPPSHPAPGLILPAQGRVFVATGTGTLEVLALKPAGGVRMDGAAWLRGARLTPGARLGS
jgi:methionyl-tRNA formyltransferase